MRRFTALLVGLAALGGAATASAAKPVPASLALVGTPTFSAEVTFDYTTTAELPFVTVECRQAGAVVYQEAHGRWWLHGTDPFIFTLGPTNLWTSGDADCTADLREYDAKRRYPYRVLASITFTTEG
jgi:hypothetical protein